MKVDIDKIDAPAKYQKKQASNTSSAKAKSKHKHVYNKVVILAYKYEADRNNPNAHIFAIPYTYCSICGKLGKSLWHLDSTKIYNTLRFTLERYRQEYPEAPVIKCTYNNLWKLKTIQEFQEAEKCIDLW